MASFFVPFFFPHPWNLTEDPRIGHFSLLSLFSIHHLSNLVLTHCLLPSFLHHPFRATLFWSVLRKFSCIRKVWHTALEYVLIVPPGFWVVKSFYAIVVSGTVFVVRAGYWKRWQKGPLSTAPSKCEPSRRGVGMENKILQIVVTRLGTGIEIIWWKIVHWN